MMPRALAAVAVQPLRLDLAAWELGELAGGAGRPRACPLASVDLRRAWFAGFDRGAKFAPVEVSR